MSEAKRNCMRVTECGRDAWRVNRGPRTAKPSFRLLARLAKQYNILYNCGMTDSKPVEFRGNTLDLDLAAKRYRDLLKELGQ